MLDASERHRALSKADRSSGQTVSDTEKRQCEYGGLAGNDGDTKTNGVTDAQSRQTNHSGYQARKNTRY